MALTRRFIRGVRQRAQVDPVFRKDLFKQSLEAFLAGELDSGKARLRNYINATVGFESLSSTVGMPAKSLHRMLGPRGNPSSTNLLYVISALQDAERVRLKIEVADVA